MIHKIKDSIDYEIEIDTEKKEAIIRHKLNTPKRIYAFNIIFFREFMESNTNELISKHASNTVSDFMFLLTKELEKDGTNS